MSRLVCRLVYMLKVESDEVLSFIIISLLVMVML